MSDASVFTSQDLRAKIPNLAAIISSSSNTTDIVNAINQMDEDRNYSSGYLEMPACYADDFFTEEVLESSIFLALRSSKALERLVLVSTDRPVKTSRITIAGAVGSVDRKTLAHTITQELVRNPKATGFTLEFRYNSSKQPVGYDCFLLELTEPVTRAELIAKADAEYSAILIEFKNSLNQGEAGAVEMAYAEYTRRYNGLREKVTVWKPRFIATSSLGSR